MSGIYLTSAPARDEADIELSEWLFSSSPRGSLYSLTTVDADQQECEPLIASPSTSSPSPRSTTPRIVRHGTHFVGANPTRAESNRQVYAGAPSITDSEEINCFEYTIGKWQNSKFGYDADKLAVEAEPGLTTAQELMLNNLDLKPVEPERRQWGAWNFVGFWITDSFNINTWMISASMITSYGLSWWQSLFCVWLGYFTAACFVCLTGRIGATYHIGFPVVARSSFGIWGSLWPVFNRAAMACIWYGVQAWIGGTCVCLMIRSIWPSWQNLPNTMPTNSGTNTRDFVSFFIFWLLSLPAIWFPPHKIRHLFTVKSYFVPTAAIAFFIWAIVRAHGIGPIVHQPGTAHGSKLGWGMVKGVMSSIANFATLILNDPDFARFARKPRDALWSQLITIPVGFAVTSFIGIMVSSSSSVIYGGQPIWNPLDLLSNFLEGADSAQRFGVFTISLTLALSQLGTNVAANSISAGTDMAALFPRYLNIRRGGYICAAVGLVMCPWNLLSSSNQFTTYLSAYSVFLSSIAGVVISDYYFVKHGYLQVKDLYSGKNTGPYFFFYGFNWRAYAAYIAGILINVVGFAGAIGDNVPVGATYIYNLNFFAGFIISSTVYWLCCKYFPIPATSDHWLEVGDEIRNFSVAYDNDSGSDDIEADAADRKGAEDEVIPVNFKRSEPMEY